MGFLQNRKYEMFVQEITNGISPQRAYKELVNGKTKNPQGDAKTLMARPEVKKRIEEIQKSHEKVANLTRERKENLLSEIAENPDENTRDRLSAIKLHNEMLGHIAPSRVEFDNGLMLKLNMSKEISINQTPQKLETNQSTDLNLLPSALLESAQKNDDDDDSENILENE